MIILAFANSSSRIFLFVSFFEAFHFYFPSSIHSSIDMFISLNNLFSAPFFAYSAAIASIHPSKAACLTLQNPLLTSLSSFRYEASLFKGARLPLAAQIACWLEVRSVVW